MLKFRYVSALVITVASLLVGPPARARDAAAGGLIAVDLRCEHLVDPLGIDDSQPRLSWKLVSQEKTQRGQRQSAYRLLVASDRSLLDQDRGDLWDSGRVASDRSLLVPYAGASLRSRVRCWWKVCVWDEHGRASPWSAPAFWSMGLLTADAWKGAKWIGLDETDDPGIAITDVKSANWLWYPEGNAAGDAPVATR